MNAAEIILRDGLNENTDVSKEEVGSVLFVIYKYLCVSNNNVIVSCS